MIATYRLQLRPEFGFDEVRALVPYFQRLGVSHLYLSPITEARPGSTHGYDVTDHNAVRAAFGGRAGFDRLLERVREAGLELILDFVPNHAGVGPKNERWQDMLAYGPGSAAAATFDVDWQPLKPELQGKILLPFLGASYGEALDEGELALRCEEGRFYATYYDNRFALNPASCARVLETLGVGGGEDEDAARQRLKDLAAQYRAFTSATAGEDDQPERAEGAATLREETAALSEDVDLNEALARFDGAALHDVLEAQHWRLAHWKTAGDEVNYRRFFSVNELVALRMENPAVFADAHRLLKDLLAQDGVAGVRIDHIDGLADPHTYLRDLKEEIGAENIWVEKILAPGEALPPDWPVEGTTGYVFMNEAMGALLRPAAEEPLTETYEALVPEAIPYDQEVERSKRLVMDWSLSSERARLVYELSRLSEADYHTRDFTRAALHEALTDVVAAFDRYRTYLPHGPEEAAAVIRAAAEEGRIERPDAAPGLYEFVVDMALGGGPESARALQQAFTQRFQQYTAPVAAKGVEDTAFYRYVRLAALCEVGGEPDHVGLSAQAFHGHAATRAEKHPRNLLASATHDHKRGEDTRMRLVALAEVPDGWRETVDALAEIATEHRTAAGPSDSLPSPSGADAYLFYQMMAALWPEDGEPTDALADRLAAYMQKAAREAKQQTSWAIPNEEYEDALETFVRGMLGDPATADALDDLAGRLRRYGFTNTLSQLVLKCTAPGVPDFYQGTELLDLSLVDPDNRRPVDYAHRQALLDEMADLLDAPEPEAIRAMTEAHDARAKCYFTARLLRLRADHAAALDGPYEPLPIKGEGADQWLAYARGSGENALLVIVPRFPAAETRDATIPLPDGFSDRAWTNVLTGASVEAEGGALRPAEWPLPWGVLAAR